MGSLPADDRSFLEAALKSAHEAYKARNGLSMKSHHEAGYPPSISPPQTDQPRPVNTCPAATLEQCYIHPPSL
jgi:hypothetical protein